MKGYQNLRLKTKLLTGFMLMALVAIAIGVVGAVGINRVSQNNVAMYDENTKPMSDLATMYDTLAAQRICAANMVIFHTENPEFAREETQALDEKEAQFEEAFAVYRNTITTDEEQALYDEMDRLYHGEFVTIKDNLRAAASSGDLAAMAEAMKAIDDMGAEISGYMDEAFAFNVDSANGKVASNQSVSTTTTVIQAAVTLAGIGLALLCGFYLAALIVAPITRIMNASKQVGDTGSLEFSPEVVDAIQKDALCKDETGQTAQAFARMMDSLIEKTKLLEQVAEGDLSIEVTKASDRDTMGNALEKMVRQLNEMFGEINTATDQVSTGSTQIAQGAQGLAQATSEQAATVEELLASIGQVAANTRENAERASHTAALAGSIKESAEQGTDQMNRMIQAVEEINAASQSISAVIKVIDDIAFQTNILALNAAVEAARAGEHGKGFAVVADEVRNLAGKSADAAKNTGSMIADTVEKAELGARIAKETSESLGTIVTGINESNTLVSEIASSSEQQSRSIGEINLGLDQVSQVVQQNSATSEESAAAAEEMNSQADMLKSMVARFKLRQQYQGVPRGGPSVSPAPSLPAARSESTSSGYIF